jgi:antitoxin component YwqK of YwqJK toxin-antitoxin module
MNSYDIYKYTEKYTERYVKYKEYIIKILIESYLLGVYEKDSDNENSTFSCNDFKVLSIEHMITKLPLTEIFCDFSYHDGYLMEINNTYKKNIKYYKTYERSFIENFMNDKQYLLYTDGYSGDFIEYEFDGKIICEYYHINGIIHGEYKKYFNDSNKLHIKCEYVNGNKHGEYRKYHINGNINIVAYYNNNNLTDIYKVYDINNTLTYEAIYDNGKLIKYSTFDFYSGELLESNTE